jgi:hypothetical protein
MTAWLLAVLDRLPYRWRRVALGGATLLLVAAAITALIVEAPQLKRHRPRARAAPLLVHPPPGGHAAPLTPPPPVSAADMRRATEVAERFAVSYLAFVYGRATARSVVEITRTLRTQLARGRSPVTPIERQRRPRLLSLHTVGTMPGFVVATAIVEDGGIAAYRLRFTLSERSRRWLVGTVEDG